MKFRKRVQVIPGLTINISKSGFSTTVGVRGASINVGKNGAFLNTSIPGTGLYDRKKINVLPASAKPQRVQSIPRNPAVQESKRLEKPSNSYRLTPGNRQTSNLERLTPTEMHSFLAHLKQHLAQRIALKQEYKKLLLDELRAQRLVRLSKWLIYGWFYKGHEQKMAEINALRNEVLEDWQMTHFALDSNINVSTSAHFQELLQTYTKWTHTHKIWDIVSQFPNNQGCYDFERQEIKLNAQFFEGIQREMMPLFFKNTFGTCVYVYQEFILISRHATLIAVAPLQSLKVTFEEVDFPEKSIVPNDTDIVGQTWVYTTKNGEPDRRYKNNPAISICRYALIHFTTAEGMLETFMCSDIQKTKALVEAFVDYIKKMEQLLT